MSTTADGRSTASADDDDVRAGAERRLDTVTKSLRTLGATVDGDVGVENPVDAVAECVRVGTYDEIIVSTLPTHLSRWLRQDVPHRIERKFHIPVATVTDRADAVERLGEAIDVPVVEDPPRR